MQVFLNYELNLHVPKSHIGVNVKVTDQNIVI